MICKKCGSNVDEGIAFCMQCGNKLEPTTDLSKQPTQQGQNKESEKKLTKDRRKLFLAMGIGVAVLVVIAILVLLIMSRHPKEYSVVGEWHSRDAIAIGEILQKKLEKQGENKVVSSLVGAMNNIAGAINLIFTESGKVYIGVDDLLVSIGEFTYAVLGNNKILLEWKVDISVLGTGVPVTLVYRANYQVTEDTLQLDLFGYEAMFDRVEW